MTYTHRLYSFYLTVFGGEVNNRTLKDYNMNTWKTIQSFTYPHEAHVVKNYLESNGVEVNMQDEMTAQVNNFYSNAIGGVKLQVKEADVANGQKLLEEGGYDNTTQIQKKRKVERITKDENTNVDLCPYCRSENIAKRKEPNIAILVLFLLINALFPIFKSHYQCFDCGREWKYKK